MTAKLFTVFGINYPLLRILAIQKTSTEVNRSLRRITGIRWPKMINNTELRETTGETN